MNIQLYIILVCFKVCYGLWPYSSKGKAKICYTENDLGLHIVCDCTEPNVICKSRNLTEYNFVLPDDTDIVDFSRNSILEVKQGLQARGS